MRSPASVRSYLVWLVAASLVPVLLFAAYLLWQQARSQRAMVEASLQRSVQAIRVALDREIYVAVSALETLRHSEALTAGDLAAFERMARFVKAQYPHWLGIVLTRPDGQQVMNLAAKPGQPLPNIGHYAVIQEVIAHRAPAVSELLVGRVRAVPLVGIDVPVMRGDELAYVLGLSMPAAHFQALLAQIPVPPGAVARIVDHHDNIVAQSGPAAKAVDASAGMIAHLGSTPEGLAVLEAGGQTQHVRYSRSQASRWFAAVSLPEAAFAAASRQSLAWLAFGGGVLLALSLAAALFLGRRIAAPIERLSRSANAIVRGSAPADAARAPFAELQHLETALRGAGELQRRTAEESEAAREALRQAQKLEAIGRLTGGIAHDFNNLLAVVANSLAVLERSENPDIRSRTLAAVKRAAERGATLVRQLLVFARGRELQPQTVDVLSTVAHLQTFLASSLRSDITIDTDFPPEGAAAHCDPTQLELALLNLALNARDAMPKGGCIRFAARNEGARVIVTVSDTGLGMSAETLARAFEPFFTTKGPGQGSGMGLSQVYAFARQSGGDALIASASGEGTKVTLLLPRATPGAETETRAVLATSPRKRRALILLVEDDPEVALTTQALIGELGHGVVRARSAAEALDLLKGGEPFDLVISDIIMPGEVTGIDLALEIGRRWPDLPVVLATGYAGAAGDAEAASLKVLRKPYGAAELQEAIERCTSVRRVDAA